jgi:hypothetical protein
MTDPLSLNHDELGLATAAMDAYQIEVAKELFEWWWVRPNVQQYAPSWEKCDPTIQAFWMDGAWRAIRVG